MRDRLLGVWVRNPQDAAALADLGIPARFTPDIVFQLGEAVDACDTSRLPRFCERKTLLVFPSNNATEAATRERDLGAYHYYEFMMIEMAKTLDYLGKYYDIMFVPLSKNANDNDIVWALRTYALMRNKGCATILDRQLTPIEVAALTKKASMVMSMKFHGSIFALLAARPFVNIGLTRKTQLLCEDNNLRHISVPPFAFSYERVLHCLKAAETPETFAAVSDASRRLRTLARTEGSIFVRQVEEAVLREHGLQSA
jgi:polysaccharide pyruvyl transferase WcaK-like protein